MTKVAPLEICVNGSLHQVNAAAGTLLIDYLRDSLGLKGTKLGCGTGECGSCTLLLDGDPICACLCTLSAAAGRSVTTIEGIADDDSPHPIQQALVASGAIQCGYCTPGVVLSTFALLTRHPKPDRQDMLAFLNGNLCPCGGYPQVLQAIESLVEASRAE